MPTPDSALTIAIGASAGGFRAICELIEHLPTDTGCTFLVIQHLKADQKSMLAPLLQTHTAMPVSEMTHQAVPEPDHIYVTPSGYTAALENAQLLLQPIDSATAHQDSIDKLFASVANSATTGAVGVLLSGSGSDGTEGLRHIKSAGGITFAQDRDSAEFAQMPGHAIDAGCVDMALSPTALAAQLASLKDHPLVLGQEQHGEPHGDYSLDPILTLIREQYGFDFGHYKRNTILRRVRRRMLLKHIEDDSRYLDLLRHSPDECSALVQDFMINVTSLFRDPEVFDAIKHQVLPHLFEEKPGNEALRVWVPGCSTGEEAYSLAILIAEFMDEQHCQVPVQIFATDLDGAAVATARAGIYTPQQVAPLNASRLSQFFTRTLDGNYQVGKRIRGYCIFSEQDVIQDPPFARLDLISCRNLLIYLDESLQTRLFTLFHFALQPWGRLVLGLSESISNGTDYFSTLAPKRKIYSKNAVKRILPRPSRAIPSHHYTSTGTPSRTMEHDNSIQTRAEQIILNEFGPPGVIVDDDLTICRFIGHTGPFIEPAPGSVSLKLLKMVQRDLLMDLRETLSRARDTQQRAEAPNVRFDLKSEQKMTRIVVHPLYVTGSDETYCLVLFADVLPEPRETPEARAPDEGTGETAPPDQRVRELETELLRTRQELKTVISDHVATNEELQNANEQIQSANEELQSTNEELESAQEELQSTNEELATLNDELEARNSDLAQVNADLRNLLSSVQLPVLMLNRDFEVRQFTPLAKPLLNLIDTDVGRSFSDLSPNLDLPDLKSTIHAVIASGESQTIEASDPENRVYSISLRPYRDLDDQVVGAVMVFFDITSIRHDP